MRITFKESAAICSTYPSIHPSIHPSLPPSLPPSLDPSLPPSLPHLIILLESVGSSCVGDPLRDKGEDKLNDVDNILDTECRKTEFILYSTLQRK